MLLNANTNPVTITAPNSGTLTLNSVIQIKASEGFTIAAGTGVSNVVIGAEKNLVIAMDNNAGFGISAPIVDDGGGASAVTIVGGLGTGGATLSGDNAYTGVTTVDGTATTATTATRSLLTVGNNNALGTTAGGTVLIGGPTASGDGARILLNNGITVTGETLTIRTGSTGNRSTLTQASNAISSWNGNIVVDANTGFSQIFANGTTGTLGTGNVTNAATLQFSRTDTYTLAAGNIVTGAGAATLANIGNRSAGNSSTATQIFKVDISGGTLDMGGNDIGTLAISPTTVTYTFPAGTKNFARLKVTGP